MKQDSSLYSNYILTSKDKDCGYTSLNESNQSINKLNVLKESIKTSLKSIKKEKTIPTINSSQTEKDKIKEYYKSITYLTRYTKHIQFEPEPQTKTSKLD
jgi:hypothetical protein